MAHRKCDICRKPIVLVPSAAERAKKYGNPPQYFLNLFTTHTECFLRKREQDTLDLIRKHR